MTLTRFVASAAAIALGLCAVMTVAWWIQQCSGKSGLVDACWTFGVGASAIVAALLPLSARYRRARFSSRHLRPSGRFASAATSSAVMA